MVSLPITLPKGVNSLVKEGEHVKKGQILAKHDASAEHVIHLASVLKVKPHSVADLLQKQPGDSIEKGEIIAVRKKSFGFSRIKLQSNISGMITHFDEETGDLTVGGELGEMTEVLCPIDGDVLVCNNEQIVIQTNEHVIQGKSGIGAAVQGSLYILPSVKEREIERQQLLLQLTSEINNRIVVARDLHRDALIKAIGLESKGIIAVTVLQEDLDYLQQRNMQIPIVLVDEDKLPQLAKQQGKEVFIEGSTGTILLLE